MADPFQMILDKISQMSRRERLAISFGALALAGIVLIVLVIVQVWLPNRMVAYNSASFGISAKYPLSWKKIENEYGAVAVFLAPKEGALDVFQENVTFIVQDISKNPVSLKAYTETAIRQVQAVFKSGIEIVESEPTYFAGQTAHKFIYAGVDKNRPELNLKAMYVWFIKDDRAYQFNYTAMQNKFDKYLGTVEKMMSSFEVK